MTVAYFQDAYTWYENKGALNRSILQFNCFHTRYVYVAKKMPEWLGMLVIFQYTTWIITCLILIVSAISWYIFGHLTLEERQHSRFAICLLNSWAVTICIAVNNRPERTPLRFFFIALALYSINLTTIYTSKLISVFTNPPYEDQIDTIDEIVESHLPIGKFINGRKRPKLQYSLLLMFVIGLV